MTESNLPFPRPAPRPLLFARARESLADALSAAVTDALPAIAEELDLVADRAIDGRERQALMGAAQRLRRESATRVTQVADALARRANRCLEIARLTDQDADDRALALIDDEELETQILAADLARAARDHAGVVYPRYAGRLRQVVERDWGDDEMNPLGARTLAGAAIAALEGIVDGARLRAVLRRMALATLAEPIAAAIARADRLLEDAGVQPPEPPLPAEPPLPPESPEPPPESPVLSSPESPVLPPPVQSPLPESGATRIEEGATPPVPPGFGDWAPAQAADREAVEQPPQAPCEEHPQEALPELPGVERRGAEVARAVGAALQAERDAATLGSSPLAGTPPGERLRVLPTLQPVVEIERDAVAFAHAIGAIPYSRQARGEFFGNVRARMRETGAAPAQVAVVDLVAAMFDYVIDDRRLPEAAKPLVWRLQQPAVALALLDPAYLGDDPRSLRKLIEHFGAISTAFGEDIVRGSELYRRLETVVRAVEIVSSALQSRAAVMAQQVEKEYSRAARNVGQLIDRVVRERRALEETPGRRNRRDYARRPSRERERLVTESLRALLEERLARHQAPDSVRDFVTNVWLRHMRTAALRNGEESAEFRVSLQVVDDLLWSLNGGEERRSRRELAQRIPPLIRLMTQGVREIGAKEEEFKSFFDELFLIHLRRMQRRERERGASTRAGLDREAGAGPVTAAAVPTLAQPLDVETAIAPGEGEPGESEPPAGQPAAQMPEPPTPEPPSAPPPAPPAPVPPAPATTPSPEEGTERRLLEILDSLDLGDLPARPRRRELEPAQALEQIRRGDWVELLTRERGTAYLKVAWINRRRTVALLVRYADRRAMSLRMDELRARFEQARAFLLAAD
ncbi:MAG TPA: DUF1631 family protein [Burkholderiaceae bacterium]|nr:DUF1631 family protein [Burkholderiaceae bacterium]